LTQFLPFKGIYYNRGRIKGSDVLAPPYDIISPEKKDALYHRSPYNIVRIDFGRDLSGDNETENRYGRASKLLAEWLSEGTLVRHRDKAFYVYEAEYRFNGALRRLRGIIGKLKLVDLGKGVYPHEETHSGPKMDRLNLMRSCKANISPIFSLYSSRSNAARKVLEDLTSRGPYLEAADDWGVMHRMWIADDENSVRAIMSGISGNPVFIADGHHRYETALAYRKEMHEKFPQSGEAPYDYVMMFLVHMNDEGLTILPTHRLVDLVPGDIMELLRPYFAIETLDKGKKITEEIALHDRAIGMYLHGDERFYVLHPENVDLDDINPILKDLDVTVLHKLVFKKLLNTDIIIYEMDGDTCVDMVRRGDHKAVFFLKPTRVQEIEKVALNGLRMPPKSTYFYPKLLTGFVIHSFE
jgi:uncharacterized protein (DUF1015 family)